MTTKEQIEHSFANKGWDLDGSFAEYLLIGYKRESNLSILAYEVEWTTDEPVFEIIDHERGLTYGVQEIPSPEQAQELLRKNGQPAEDWEDGLGRQLAPATFVS